MEFPHIVEIAWKTGKKVNRYLVKPDGYKVPKAATAIHGISHEQAMAEGKPLRWILEQVIADAFVSKKVIGHNTYFDSSVLKANVLREFGPTSSWANKAKKAFDKHKRVCTMRLSRRIMGGRWPKLQAAHVYFFGEEFEGAHGAAEDVLACERIYKELKRMGEHD